MSENAELAKKIVEYLKTQKSKDNTDKLADTAKRLLATFQSLRRIDSQRAQEIADLVVNCQKRTDSILNVSALPGVDDDFLLTSMHDNLLIAVVVIFSVYEHFYKEILYEILHCYCVKANLVSGLLEPPRPAMLEEHAPTMHITEALSWPYLSMYQLPLVLRILIASSDPITEIFANVTQMSLEDAKERRGELGNNLMHSMGIRNRIAHMSEKTAYYSLDRKTMQRNAQDLAIVFPMIVQTVLNLFLLFSEFQSVAPLQIKPGRREAILNELSNRIDEDKLDAKSISKLLSSAISRLQTDPDIKNDRLFRS